MRKLRELTTRLSLAELVEVVSKTLKSLEGTNHSTIEPGETAPKVRPKDEKLFVKFHKTQKFTNPDRLGNPSFSGNVKVIDRPATRQGHKAGSDNVDTAFNPRNIKSDEQLEEYEPEELDEETDHDRYKNKSYKHSRDKLREKVARRADRDRRSGKNAASARRRSEMSKKHPELSEEELDEVRVPNDRNIKIGRGAAQVTSANKLAQKNNEVDVPGISNKDVRQNNKNLDVRFNKTRKEETELGEAGHQEFISKKVARGYTKLNKGKQPFKDAEVSPGRSKEYTDPGKPWRVFKSKGAYKKHYGEETEIDEGRTGDFKVGKTFAKPLKGLTPAAQGEAAARRDNERMMRKIDKHNLKSAPKGGRWAEETEIDESSTWYVDELGRIRRIDESGAIAKHKQTMIKYPKFDARGNLVLTKVAKDNTTFGKRPRKLSGKKYDPDKKEFGEEAEQLDELSPATYGSYIKGAHKERWNHALDYKHHMDQNRKDPSISDKKAAEALNRKDNNRVKYVSKAVKRLSEEEQLDEFKARTAEENEWANRKYPGKGDTVLVSPKGHKGGGKVTRIAKSEYDPKKHSLAEDQLDELSKKTISNYARGAIGRLRGDAGMEAHSAARADTPGLEHMKSSWNKAEKNYSREARNRETGLKRAVKRLSEEEQLDELSKEKLSRHIDKSADYLQNRPDYMQGDTRDENRRRGIRQATQRLSGTFETGKPLKVMIPGSKRDPNAKASGPYTMKKKKIYHAEETQLDPKYQKVAGPKGTKGPRDPAFLNIVQNAVKRRDDLWKKIAAADKGVKEDIDESHPTWPNKSRHPSMRKPAAPIGKKEPTRRGFVDKGALYYHPLGTTTEKQYKKSGKSYKEETEIDEVKQIKGEPKVGTPEHKAWARKITLRATRMPEHPADRRDRDQARKKRGK